MSYHIHYLKFRTFSLAIGIKFVISRRLNNKKLKIEFRLYDLNCHLNLKNDNSPPKFVQILGGELLPNY